MSKPVMVGMTKEEFENRLQHSSLGGKVVIAVGRGRDEIAAAFRHFANEYEKDVVLPQSAELQKFINGRAG